MLRAHKIDLKNFPRQNGLGKCFFIIINNGSEPKKKICFFSQTKRRRFIELERAPECVAVVASSAVCRRRVRRRETSKHKTAFNNDETRYL